MERQSVSTSLILLCGVSFLLSGTVKADLMAIWDFGPDADGYTEDVTAENVIGTPTLILRLGEKDVNGKQGIEYTDAEGNYHQAGRAGAWDNVTGDSYLLLTVNTTNWWDLRIRWDYNSENDIVGDDLGPESFDFDFRVGGTGGWTPILNNQPLTRDDAWHEFSYNLWLISAIENQPIVEFRVRDLNQGTESGGNFKIDNLELTGTTSCTISLLTPNGGERLLTGPTYDVTWQTAGGIISDVLIEYSTNDANDWTGIDTVENTGLYEWEVADANSIRCLVRVSDTENHNVNDISDDLFTIYRCMLSYDLNRDCFVDMLDFALLVSEWLQCGDPFDPQCLQ